MLLEPGDRIGPYQIQSVLGAGSMGEVYRAHDARLARDVAIKVLPAASSDADASRRFEQEARAAAALRHPNILAVYDVGTERGFRYIVSELVEGETLRAQLDRRRLRASEALEYARQIARGLEAAHGGGVAHRDLKPENLLVSDGRITILDFGLAKLVGAPTPLAPADAATSSTTLTSPGMVLGTVGYMSPEQVRGLPADHRSDIFSFGAILYEMLSGQRAFRGETAADTMTAILKDEPPPFPPSLNIPPGLARVVQRCLEKSSAARFQSAGDLAFVLDGLSGASGLSAATPSTGVPSRRVRASGIVVLSLVIAGAILAAVLSGRHGARQPAAVYRSSILPPEQVSFSTGSPAGGLALSPDGRRLVFTAQGREGGVMLWVRSLDGLTAQPLEGTDGAFFPFWSPDSRSVAFFAGGSLKKIDVAGGSPVTLCATPRPSILAAGGSWSREGVILFAQATAPIHRVAAMGGTPVPATRLDEQAGETQHWAPYFLPDGRHFLYFAVGSLERGPDDPNGVYVAQLGSTERTQILAGGSNAKYADGYVIFPRERTLVAQPFDLQRLELTGDAVPIADQIAVGGLSGRTGAFSLSETGVLAYQGTPAQARSALTWFDRAGAQVGVLDVQADYGDLELSPDRQEALVSVLDPLPRSRDLFLVELARGLRSRFTFAPTDEQTAVWSPDGRSVIYNARPKGYFDLYAKDVSGRGDERVVFADSRNKTPLSWSADGKWLLYSTVGGIIGNSDVWLLPLEGNPVPVPFLRTPFNEGEARFSPDGRLV
ncbi:MAG: protein kinase, partial [Vicinamibacterales bacterium]